MGKYGTNLDGLGSFEGGINSDSGATLISTRSVGEQATMFGPSALREIQTGVANGDFSLLPIDPSTTIGESNPLPYWSFTTNSALVTATPNASTSSASSNVLRFNIATTAASTVTGTLSRFVPVAGSTARSFAYTLETTWLNGYASGSGGGAFSVTMQFYKNDLTTTTGTAITSSTVGFSSVTAITPYTLSAPSTSSTSGWINTTVPSDAAYLKISINITNGATAATTSYVDLVEVRLNIGQAGLLLPDITNPSAYAPTLMYQSNGYTYIKNDPAVGTAYIALGAGPTFSVYGTTTINGDLSATGTITSTGAMYSGGNLYPGGSTSRFFNISDSAVSTNGILQARSGTSTGAEVRSRGSTTYCGFFWNGTYFTITDPLKIDGTTPTTASAANMRLNATTGGVVQINTSSRRWKDNIEDVDAETLAAAKRLKARHFTSLHEVDGGKRLLGMIAEEVDEAGLNCGVEYDAEGKPYALDWNAITAALLARLEDAERRIVELEAKS